MAADVDVQYFSHLNGLTLGNNWGDMIRLLDTCLVNGLPFTSVKSASIDAQGDITLNLYAAHNALLFQIVELTGFLPLEINGKYRIKGTPTTTRLVLKTEHVGKTITTVGTAKLASLGYEIIFRDTNDVKRVYRAKNPRSEHPFIRVDETISDGVNSYNSAYAKSAMVGLLENMTHIDDYENPDVLQLPFDPSDPAKNWKIAGTGTDCVRGWAKWYWAHGSYGYSDATDSIAPADTSATFTLAGNADAVYIIKRVTSETANKSIQGFGLYDSSLSSDVIPNWFLMAVDRSVAAGTASTMYTRGGLPLINQLASSTFFTTKYSIATPLSTSVTATPVIPDYLSGVSALFSATVGALQVPFYDSDKYLRGTLKHVFYAGSARSEKYTVPLITDKSMFVWDSCYSSATGGGLYFYLGELE